MPMPPTFPRHCILFARLALPALLPHTTCLSIPPLPEHCSFDLDLMMEAVEATLVEGAVLWLAQTILANLLLDKLDAWLRHVGLADDIEKLKYAVEEVEALAASVKGMAAGSRLLALRLSRLKELLYEADDLVDELDYCRLHHEVQGGIDVYSCRSRNGLSFS